MIAKTQNTLKDIITLIESPSKEEVELITKAYGFAQKAHEGHARYSGEPYFSHLFATAKTLAELGMDASAISAGLLHDSIEDAKISTETIQKEFGNEVLFLIEGVTKLGKLKYRGAQRHTESLRKLFVAMAEDLRVLIIKLCDRLHNMHTLEYVPEQKQKRIALETLEIFAPLAYRLGMRKLNRELEDLAFSYVYPKEYKETENLLKEKSEELTKNLTKNLNLLKKALAKENITKFNTEHRTKGLYSLYKKLQRKDKDINKVYDVFAIRIIVPSVSDCYQVLGIVHSIWRPLPGRIKDYIAFPKPNGYQSIHSTVLTGDGAVIEIQIRTEQMHKDAEYGIASHLSYKEGKNDVFSKNLAWIASLLPRAGKKKNASINSNEFTSVPEWIKHLAEEQLSGEPEEFMKNLKNDFFEHRLFVFTPKGDVVDLPINSSPIDFAYAIHSDIGDHMSGAKVNGKLVSLDTTLHNGDIVEIITKQNSKPSPKWVEIAKTNMAKRHIKNFLERMKKTNLSA